MEQAGDREKSREPRQVAHQRLALDLLAQVELDVSTQGLVRRIGGEYQGERADLQGPLEIEVLTQLLGGQGEHLSPQGATPEQIDSGGAELASARPEQREAQPALLDEAVDLVQQAGQALDLVDHDPASRVEAAELAGERAGIGQQALVEPLVEQVEPVCVRKPRPDPGALADPAQPEQEEAAGGQAVDARQSTQRHVAVILHRKTTSRCPSGFSCRTPAPSSAAQRRDWKTDGELKRVRRV